MKPTKSLPPPGQLRDDTQSRIDMTGLGRRKECNMHQRYPPPGSLFTNYEKHRRYHFSRTSLNTSQSETYGATTMVADQGLVGWVLAGLKGGGGLWWVASPDF